MLNVTHEFDTEVPMRDGVLLRGTLFRPEIAEPVPVLLTRSPYVTKLQIPNIDVTGWYDHCNSSLDHLMGMQKHGGSELTRK